MTQRPPSVPAKGEPDDLWERLAVRPRPFKIVDFPAKGVDGKPLGQLALWVLLQHEIEMAAATAAQRARRAINAIVQDDKAKTVTGSALGDSIDRVSYGELYDNARACELLFRACRHAKDVNRPAFPTVDDLRLKLGSDEIAVLMSYYYTVQSELGPIAANMSAEDVDAWIERLAVSGERYPLGSLSSDAHQQLTFALALRCKSSQTVKSSAGSLPESETTSGEADRSQASASEDVTPTE